MITYNVNELFPTPIIEIEIEENTAVVTREIDEGLERIKVNIPFIASCDLRLYEPRYASLPNIIELI